MGKTALLEATFLLLGPTNPELPLRVNVFRGIEQMKNDPEEIWGWLFYDKNFDQPIKLAATTEGGKERKLDLVLKEPSDLRGTNGARRPAARKSVSTISTTDSSPAELHLRYKSETGSQFHTRAYLKETGLGFARAKPIVLPTSVYITARGGYSSENPERYSRLEEVGKEKEILPVLQTLEPRLKRLAVLAGMSGPMIHGDIGLDRMVPVPFMGEGVGRLMTILLAIVSCTGGVVLVDEIETGLHYSAMTGVWSALARAARQFDVQIIATTHSWECLKAAQQAFTDADPYDFALHRLDRQGEIVRSVAYGKEQIEMALSSGLELR